MSYAYTIAAIATVVAAGVQQQNQKNAARKQDQIITNGIINRQKMQAAESDRIQAAARQLQDSNAAPSAAKATTQYLSDLQSGKPLATVGQVAPSTGVLSTAYQQAAGAANAKNASDATTNAGLFGLQDAIGLQRQNEQKTINGLSTSLNGLNSQANDQTSLAELRARGVAPNPYVSLAASALGAAGQAYGGKIAAGTGTATPTSTSTLGYQDGSVLGGTAANYTGPQSVSTDYMSNIRRLYGNV